jgi:membrane protease YdiL (CAAX protease family)
VSIAPDAEVLAGRTRTVRRIAAGILLGIAAVEAIPLTLSTRWLHLLAQPQPVGAVLGALLIAAGYVVFSVRSPGVRRHLGDRSWLRIPAILLAIVAGIFEELYFRRVLMNALQAAGYNDLMQIVASAVTFGVAHAFWGIRAGWRVALGVSLATGSLGLALAILYVLGGRAIVPCIEAHILIDLILEPALMLNAVEANLARRNSWSTAELAPS